MSDRISNNLENTGKWFARKKDKITELLAILDSDDKIHSEALDAAVKHIKKQFFALNVEDVLDAFDHDPNMDEGYGCSADQLGDWSNNVSDLIDKLFDKANKQVQDRKSAVSYGF